jgi:glycosyltransferase involved in cell wall biosynthesis
MSPLEPRGDHEGAGASLPLPTLRIFATNLPRFVSDFSVIPNVWSGQGGEVRLYAPDPVEEEGVWWADPGVVSQARSRLAPEIEVRPLPFDRHKRDLTSVLRGFSLAHTLAHRRPDDVFLFWAIPPSVLLGLPFRMRDRRCVFMLTGLGSIFGSASWSARLLRTGVAPFLGTLLRGRNSRAITHNHEDREYFVREHGVEPHHIMVTGGCGIEPREFPFQEHWPVNDPPVILVPVRLLREKGVRDAAEASTILDARGIRHEMWFSHTFDEGNPLSLTKRDAEELAYRHRRIRFTGYRPHAAPLFQASDVICVPTWYREGLPTALLEAAASGRPIVTTDNVGGREFIEDGRNGFLVPPRNPRALADALEKLLADREVGERFRRRAFSDFESGYTKTQMLERTLETVASLGVPVPSIPSRGRHHA